MPIEELLNLLTISIVVKTINKDLPKCCKSN